MEFIYYMAFVCAYTSRGMVDIYLLLTDLLRNNFLMLIPLS